MKNLVNSMKTYASKIGLDWQRKRLNVIGAGLKALQGIHNDIQAKIGIWVRNDPMFSIDDLI